MQLQSCSNLKESKMPKLLFTKKLNNSPTCHLPDPMIAYMCIGANVALFLLIHEYRKRTNKFLMPSAKQARKVTTLQISITGVRLVQEYCTVKKPLQTGELCVYYAKPPQKGLFPMPKENCQKCLEPPTKYVYALILKAYAVYSNAKPISMKILSPTKQGKPALCGKEEPKLLYSPKKQNLVDRRALGIPLKQLTFKNWETRLKDGLKCMPEINSGWDDLEKKPIKEVQTVGRDSVCQMCSEPIKDKRFFDERRFAILKGCDHLFCYVCIRKRCPSKFPLGPVVCPKCNVSSDKFAASSRWVSGKDKIAFFKAFDESLSGLYNLHKQMNKIKQSLVTGKTFLRAQL